MTRRTWPNLRTGHRASLVGALACLLCTFACATQGDETGGRPAELPGTGGSGGEAGTAEAGLGGATGSPDAGSGGVPGTADANPGGGRATSTDAAVRELPPECVFTEAELNELMALSDERDSPTWRVFMCVGDALRSACAAPFLESSFTEFCLGTTVTDVERGARASLQLNPEQCPHTPEHEVPNASASACRRAPKSAEI